MAVLVPSGTPVEQNLLACELEVHLPFPRRAGEPSPIRLVNHITAMTPPLPRSDSWPVMAMPVILSTFSRLRGADTSSWVT